MRIAIWFVGESRQGHEAALAILEKSIKPSTKDRMLTDEIAGISELIRAGELAGFGNKLRSSKFAHRHSQFHVAS